MMTFDIFFGLNIKDQQQELCTVNEYRIYFDDNRKTKSMIR